MEKLISFHGDKKLKAMMVKEVKWHQEQDKIIQGVYAKNGKFCAVGCSIESLNRKLGKTYNHSNHSVYETELGIPRSIARLEDRIFERLPQEDALKFPLQFIKAVPVGADLSMVMPKFILWLLMDEKYGVINFAKKETTKTSIKSVAELYQRKINGENVDLEYSLKVRSAASAAYDASAASAASAAYDASDASAASAAYAASDAYAAYDASDASAASAAYAASAASYRKYVKQCAKKLLELLKDSAS